MKRMKMIVLESGQIKQLFFINFDGYYIVRTDQGKPRTKYIFNKCGTNIYFLLYRGLVHHHHRVFKSNKI